MKQSQGATFGSASDAYKIRYWVCMEFSYPISPTQVTLPVCIPCSLGTIEQ